MRRTWRLSGLEYLVLRERLLGKDGIWPFDYLSDIPGYYDFQFAKARVWGELQASWDPELAEALVRSQQAEIRLLAQTRDASPARDRLARRVVLGRRFGDRALLIEGFYTRTPESHDELEITECPAEALARSVVERLPEAEAGSQPRVALMSYAAQESFDHWHGRSSCYEEDGDHDVEIRSRAWQAAPKGAVGSIVITQGRSAFGPSGQVTKAVFFEDHPGDGRYVVDLEPPMAAVATGADGLRALIDRHCAELLLVGADESRGGVSRASVFDDGR